MKTNEERDIPEEDAEMPSSARALAHNGKVSFSFRPRISPEAQLRVPKRPLRMERRPQALWQTERKSTCVSLSSYFSPFPSVDPVLAS